MDQSESLSDSPSTRLADDAVGHVLFVLWPIEICTEEKGTDCYLC